MTTFSAQVKDWTEKAKRNQELVFKQAVQHLADAILLTKDKGGNMPHETGNLKRSLLASTSSMPQVITEKKEFPENEGQITATIAGAKITDSIYLGFQAAYAARMNYGFVGTDSIGRTYNQSGNLFVDLAAQRWQEFIDQAAKEIGQ